MTPGIIVLEGADSSGKTTLAGVLRERYGARYLHSTVRGDIWPWHVGALRLALRHLRAGRLVVLDRHWISELVYGSVFRGGPAYDVGARCLDRVLRRYGALYVLCSPTDQEAQAARWAADREAGKLEHFDRVREVMALYADLREGNLARPGPTYLDQLIAYQDFAHRDDVIVYDLDRHRTATFADRVVARSRELTGLSLPPYLSNVSGRIGVNHAGILFVGESISPTWPDALLPRWPWCDDDRRLSSATWLNRALHSLALPEDKLAFTNALDAGGFLESIELASASPSAKVIALGTRASTRLRAVGRTPYAVLPHPQWHRRFRHGDGPEGYGELIREAIR
jgi:hypothetical protein